MDLAPHLKGHVLLFDTRPAAIARSASLRLLLAFVILEFILGPRLWLLRALGVPQPPAWIRTPMMIVVALLLVRFFASVGWTEIGLRRWREWTLTEKSYFLQIAFAATGVSLFLFGARMNAAVAVVIVTQLAWGFYQELAYRGMLQTALASRWGNAAAIVGGNLIFTFGPLHLYHFERASPWPMFAAIFAIGLFFSLLFWRSRNLWIVGVFHGIGNTFAAVMGAS